VQDIVTCRNVNPKISQKVDKIWQCAFLPTRSSCVINFPVVIDIVVKHCNDNHILPLLSSDESF
jgi:hypothetical protein